MPAVGRDAALGGLGLHLVALLAAARGWTAEDGDRKVVWARVDWLERLRSTAAAADGEPLPTVLDRLMQMPDVPGGRDDTVILGLRWTT